jgi:quercetin dioxygenase-like cupin family protein
MRPARSATGVALGLTLLALAAAGCGDDSETGTAAADTDAGRWTIGSWQGELHQRGMAPFHVRATVRSLEGAADNHVRYSGLDCRGTWTPLGGDESVYRFRERITAGRSEACKGVGTVTLAEEGGGRLSYTFRGGGVESRGTLARGTGAPAATRGAEPVRTALAQTGAVAGAPDRELVLSRVVVPPGATLPLHRHRGTQVARIESGALTYTVREGSVAVRSGQSDRAAGMMRRIEGGETDRIVRGEWIVEQPSDVHRAANRGRVPVVIVLATLLEAGAPPATPVAGRLGERSAGT